MDNHCQRQPECEFAPKMPTLFSDREVLPITKDEKLDKVKHKNQDKAESKAERKGASDETCESQDQTFSDETKSTELKVNARDELELLENKKIDSGDIQENKANDCRTSEKSDSTTDGSTRATASGFMSRLSSIPKNEKNGKKGMYSMYSTCAGAQNIFPLYNVSCVFC